MDKIVELSVRDYKAVRSADISLDGITVVSGINGCGKSTLSKLLYYSLYNANNYDKLLENFLEFALQDYEALLGTILREVSRWKTVMKPSVPEYSVANLEECQRGYLNYATEILALFDSYCKEVDVESREPGVSSTRRMIAILSNTLKSDTYDRYFLFEELRKRIAEVFTMVAGLKEKRPYVLFETQLNKDVKARISDNITIREYGVPFVGKDVSSLPELHVVRRVAYIDTPMEVDQDRSSGHGDNLLGILKDSDVGDSDAELEEVFSRIMDGEPLLVKDKDLLLNAELKYKRNDGAIFDLEDCATGIKSFSILRLLLRNGFLKKDTLLIIDEPEAHLHPQWIVEYARMIVLLRKKIGAKFFIASHSTDMVSAICYIAQKEKIGEDVCFFLAEEDREHPFEYNYKNLGLNIEPIFQSFNKSFEKLDKYGGSEDTDEMYSGN